MQIDLEAERKEILNRYKLLLKACKRRLEKGDKEALRKAFEVAVEAHKEMRRKSGLAAGLSSAANRFMPESQRGGL